MEMESNEVLVEKPERDYTRAAYQNLMAVVEFLEEKAPLGLPQKRIAEATGLSKNVVFDVCWNLINRKWAEDMGGGVIRRKYDSNDDDARMGRMVKRLVRDMYGVNLESQRDG